MTECIDYVQGRDILMTVGIRPSRPDTGYGYIQTGCCEGISKVVSFREKPDLQTAMRYLASGDYLWNAGIFVWSNRNILTALERHLPEVYGCFEGHFLDFETSREDEAIARIFAECPVVSIDYGVLEKADNVYVRCGDFGWNDVGTWESLYQLSSKDADGNVVPAFAKTYNTSNCMIRTSVGKVIVVDSLRDYIIVDTPDALMICPRTNEQHIKQVFDDVGEFDRGRFV